MSTITKITNWGDTHYPVWLDAVRATLGLFLFTKGVYFLQGYCEV